MKKFLLLAFSVCIQLLHAQGGYSVDIVYTPGKGPQNGATLYLKSESGEIIMEKPVIFNHSEVTTTQHSRLGKNSKAIPPGNYVINDSYKESFALVIHPFVESNGGGEGVKHNPASAYFLHDTGRDASINQTGIGCIIIDSEGLERLYEIFEYYKRGNKSIPVKVLMDVGGKVGN